jgi:hypothetical protein
MGPHFSSKLRSELLFQFFRDPAMLIQQFQLNYYFTHLPTDVKQKCAETPLFLSFYGKGAGIERGDVFEMPRIGALGSHEDVM